MAGVFGGQSLPSLSLSHLTLVGQTYSSTSRPGDGVCTPALGQCTALGFSPGCCSFGCLPACTCSHLPPSETLQSCQLGAVRAGQSRVSGTDVSLGLSLAVTHLFSSEGRAQGNSPQPKYRAGLPGASDALCCRKAAQVAGNLPRERPGNAGRSRSHLQPQGFALAGAESRSGELQARQRVLLLERGCQRAAAALTTL